MAFITLKDFLSNLHLKIIVLFSPRAMGERVKINICCLTRGSSLKLIPLPASITGRSSLKPIILFFYMSAASLKDPA
jgi:hypothetical protein